jgi:hypothetical protein
MDPCEIALRDTYDFVRSQLQAHSRILEAGCGNFCRDLRDDASADEIASRVLRLEASLIERGRIKAIGFRLIAPR